MGAVACFQKPCARQNRPQAVSAKPEAPTSPRCSAQFREWPVEGHLTLVHHHDTARKCLQIGQIVAGDNDRHPPRLIDGSAELEDLTFREHIQSERRFIKKDEFRLRQERKCQVGPHLLAKAQLSCRCPPDIRDTKQLGQYRQTAIVVLPLNVPDHPLPVER